MIHFLYHPHFEKQIAKLKKKYPSLEKDFEVFCLARETDPIGHTPNIVQISGLGEGVVLPIYKVRKFPLTCMKLANSGIRIIYAYDSHSSAIEFIEFAEIYHKNDQEDHDRNLLIRQYTGKTDLTP